MKSSVFKLLPFLSLLQLSCSPDIQSPPAPEEVLEATLAGPSVEERFYTAKDSREALLVFDHEVEIASQRTPGKQRVEEAIDAQIWHLFGPMAAAQIPAVPKGDHQITRIQVSPKAGARGRYIIRYHHEGTIVVQRGPRTRYKVILPMNPDEIYQAGSVRRGGTVTYPCTDEHYSDEEDFWYFWNPAQPGCPLLQGRDYRVVEAFIRPIPVMTRSYPEYERLADPNGTISIHVLIGMDEPEGNKPHPSTSRDIGAETFRSLKQKLLQGGFSSRQWSRAEITALIQSRARKLPYIEEFTKRSGNHALVIRLFFGETGIDENSRAFHYFFKDAIENASVVIYDGHSGLGGYLDLPTLEAQNGFRIRLNPRKYQIYFFNSCSSYSYYNSMFFARKSSPSDRRGTKNLDILTTGLATSFDVGHETNLVLIQAIDHWASSGGRVSYQELASEIDSENLFGVNGDEDNPRR
ncbi:MAG: hypothetical protein A2X94_15430 [Bdellovibrionales bacterium GWB1_55_8]|nr:MAG: hypothetical protein A2X94_15430 [Bdellovibrionales bacterium GWB1_55_8]